MTTEELKLLSTFETQLQHLIFLHNDSKREIENLKEQLEVQKHAYQTLEAKFQELENNYDNLRAAATISLEGGDIRETKSRLSQLVREIDKCIALLNQ